MGHLGLKRAVARVAGIFPRSRHRRYILLYHGVGDAPRAVTTGSFSEQVRYMCDQGVICRLDDLLKNRDTDGSSLPSRSMTALRA